MIYVNVGYDTSVMLCYIFVHLLLLIIFWNSQLSNQFTAHFNSHKYAFCVLMSFQSSFFQGRLARSVSLRECKSVLCVLGI